MTASHYRLPFGAEPRPDGHTRFRLWAPDAKRVDVVVDGQSAPIAMREEAGGWFETTARAAAGATYRYRIDGEIDVQDPAARFAPQGMNGPSEIIDPGAFQWRENNWAGIPWHRIVLYELHVGTFTPEGTYAAITPRLPQLAELGITAIELLPLATFPGERGWGYDGVLPFAPHPAYGRPEDLKRFVQAAHAVGIAVILDVVYNHFGPEGNYLHRYASDFFTNRYQTPWGAAIDFESPAARNVREFFIQNALYWLNEYRFDGLRLDAIHAITDQSRTHFVDELAEAIDAGPGRTRHVHLILENHDNQSRRLQRSGTGRVSKAQWNDDFHHIMHVLLTGERDGYYENYADDPRQQLARVLAEGFAYQGDPYGEQREPRGESSRELNTTAFIDFLQNHDQIGNRAFGDRLTNLADERKRKAGYAVLMLSPHIPMLFMGEEYAARQPFLYFCDYQGELAEAITNGRRSEFAGFAAFGEASARERIPDPNARETFERSRLRWEDRDDPEHRAWLDFMRELINVRMQHVIPRVASIPPAKSRAQVIDRIVWVSWPTQEGDLQMLVNCADEPFALTKDAIPHELGRVLYSTLHAAPADTLAPWECRLTLAERRT